MIVRDEVNEVLDTIRTVRDLPDTPPQIKDWLNGLVFKLHAFDSRRPTGAHYIARSEVMAPHIIRYDEHVFVWLDETGNVSGAAPTMEQAQQELSAYADSMSGAFIKGGPVPNTIGAAADLYAEVRERRLAMEKQAEAVHDRETEIYNMILVGLSESTDTGASGQRYRVQRVEKDRLQTKDWDAFWAFVRQEGAFEMLQRRLGEKAVQEWVETKGSPPPGIEVAKVASLSFNKI